MYRAASLAAACLLIPVLCGAMPPEAIVTEVVDGDTLTLAGRDVRLQGIDAPESDQPHGDAATMALTVEVHGQRVRLEVRGEDKYGRLVAVVYRDGRNVNRWIVRQGHAWEYDRYSMTHA